MIDKLERQYLSGSDPERAIQKISAALYPYGIALSPSGPHTWFGKGAQASYGMAPKVTVSVVNAESGFFVDVRVGAEFDQSGLIIFVLAWVFFFPVALVLLILGYQDFQSRVMQLMGSIWNSVSDQLAGAPQAPWGAGQA